MLLTKLEPNATTLTVWSRLKDIFHDNKASRAIYLQSEFARCCLETFSSVSAYCPQLKDIADQLSNVDAKVSDHQMVIQLVVGLL